MGPRTKNNVFILSLPANLSQANVLSMLVIKSLVAGCVNPPRSLSTKNSNGASGRQIFGTCAAVQTHLLMKPWNARTGLNLGHICANVDDPSQPMSCFFNCSHLKNHLRIASSRIACNRIGSNRMESNRMELTRIEVDAIELN